MLVTVGISLSSIGQNQIFGIRGEENEFSLTLDSSNKVTTAGDKDQYSKRGGKVTFTYSNVANSTSGHVTLNNDGTVVNKDIIHSVTSIKVTFTGSLKARLGFINDNYGDYFDLVSGKEYETGSNPYFVELKATANSTTITNATYSYSCQTNLEAEQEETSGSYDITFAATGSDSSSDISSSSSSIMAQVTAGSNYISSFSGGSKIYAGESGLKFGSSKAAGSLTINFNSTNVTEQITTVDISSAQYSTDTGKFNIYVNDASGYTEITPSAGGTVTVNGTLTSLTIETSSKRAYLCGLSLNYGITPSAPSGEIKYITGVSATDANKDTYTTNSIFAVENALSVKKLYSDTTQESIGEDDYSYVITDSNDNVINPNEKFPAIGTYTLAVSYKDYDPVIITLNVGEYVYITDVSASMTNTTFNTATTMGANLAGNLVAHLEYSNNTNSSNINYVDFAEYGIDVHLLNPKGITYDLNTPFGTAGSWTLRVFRSDDTNIKYDIPITVNAILVQTITLNESSYSLYPEDELQLMATVNPNNATNSVVNWTSNNEEVATVDENGLVTAVAVGGATITATAIDGSGVYGTCSITVTAKPKTTDYSIDATVNTQVTTNSTSDVVFTNSPVTVTINKNTSTTNANNYVASGTSAHTRVYSGQRFTISAGGTSISKIVIHGTSDKGVSGFTSPTWTNATKSSSGNEVTLTPTDSDSDVYCIVSSTSSFSGITVTCGDNSVDPVYPTAITVTGTNQITIGQTSQLTIGYTPEDTNVKNVTYTSSNTSVATVSATGLVTGVATGSATITATAEAASGTVSNTFAVTVKPISVTSVELNSNSETVKVGKTVTLVATVYPTNATNKNVSWSSSDTSVATVNNSGVVAGIAAGSATITVTTADGNKTASCVVTVNTASTAEETFSITYLDLPTTYQTGNTEYTASSGIKFHAYNCANYSKKMQFKASSGYLESTEELVLQSITINDRESNELTVYGSNTAGSFSTTITGTNDVYDLTGYSYFKISRNASGAAYCSSITVKTGVATPTDPTSIILSPTSADLAPNGTKQLNVTYVPSNANQNKAVTWTSSNTNVATVNSDGLVSVKSTATVGQTATITAKLTNIPSITATCTITVIEQAKDDHTVLIYLCGADLESKNSLATGDIQEILKVSGQPDDVNIVIETGGV